MRNKYTKAFGVAFACCFLCLATAMGQMREQNNETSADAQSPVNEAENIITEGQNEGLEAEEAIEALHIAINIEEETISEETIIEGKIAEAQEKIKAISNVSKMEWFRQYKQIQAEYQEWIDPDETIHDVYSPKELELLFRIVETEVRGDKNFEEKVHVADVIFNRMKSEKFPDTLTGVLTAPRQFSSYGSGTYKKVTVTETTMLACEYAFQFADTTNGALWFDSTDGNSWADRHKKYLFTDAVGHAFYK